MLRTWHLLALALLFFYSFAFETRLGESEVLRPSNAIYRHDHSRETRFEPISDRVVDIKSLDNIFDDEEEFSFNFRGWGTDVYDDEEIHALEDLERTSNRIGEPGIIPFGNYQMDEGRDGTDHKLRNAYQYVFNRLSSTKSEFILYPFNFTHYENDTDETFEFDEGAIISINPHDMPANWRTAIHFNHLIWQDDVEIGKAKALYDADVAILKIEGEIKGNLRDLTYESHFYCTALHSFLGKYQECFDMEEWTVWSEAYDKPGFGKTSLVYVNAGDVRNGSLLIDGITPRFGLLIIPDIILGAEMLILEKIGIDGVLALHDYVQRGGTIYSSAKSSLLLEAMQLIAEGTVGLDYLLAATDNLAFAKGCEEMDDNWVRRTLCFGVVKDKYGRYPNTLLQTFYINETVDPYLHSLLDFDMEQTPMFKKDVERGLAEPLTAEERNMSIPMVLYKKAPNWKGQIIINQCASVVFRSEDFPWFYDAVFLALARPPIYEVQVGDGEVIPGLESNILVPIKVTVTNLYDRPLPQLAIKGGVPSGIAIYGAPDDCEEVRIPAELEELKLQKYVRCIVPDYVPGFAQHTFEFVVNITDRRATQRKKNIMMMYAELFYRDEDSDVLKSLDVGPLSIDAHMAALLRTEMNIDPSSFYPLPGRGVTIDNVLTAENKEDTMAYDVVHAAVVPLITPVLDIAQFGLLAFDIPYYDAYYKQDTNLFRDHPYPFQNYGDEFYDDIHDYIDYKLLGKCKAVFSADWDTPVRYSLELRDDRFPNTSAIFGHPSEMDNAEYAATLTNYEQVLRQQYFPDCETYYEHATQRSLAHLDTNLPEGAMCRYPDGIPAERARPTSPNRCKKEIYFARTDLYFDEAYPPTVPRGITDRKSFFTYDQRENVYEDGSTVSCVPGLDTPEHHGHLLVEGYYDDTRPNGIKFNEYANGLAMDCARTRIDFADVEEASGGQVKKTHYLYRVEEQLNDIQEASDIMFMNVDEDGETGFYEGHDDIKYMKVWSSEFVVSPADTRKGGVLELVLPEGVRIKEGWDLERDSLLTWGADQVAMIQIEQAPLVKWSELVLATAVTPGGSGGTCVCHCRVENAEASGAPDSSSVHFNATGCVCTGSCYNEGAIRPEGDLAVCGQASDYPDSTGFAATSLANPAIDPECTCDCQELFQITYFAGAELDANETCVLEPQQQKLVDADVSVRGCDCACNASVYLTPTLKEESEEEISGPAVNESCRNVFEMFDSVAGDCSCECRVNGWFNSSYCDVFATSAVTNFSNPDSPRWYGNSSDTSLTVNCDCECGVPDPDPEGELASWGIGVNNTYSNCSCECPNTGQTCSYLFNYWDSALYDSTLLQDSCECECHNVVQTEFCDFVPEVVPKKKSSDYGAWFLPCPPGQWCIRGYMKRGNMPNENYGKDSEMYCNIEQLEITDPDLALTEDGRLNVTVRIYELIYDFELVEHHCERYAYVRDIFIPFSKVGFLSLPAVKMEFIIGDREGSFMMPYENLEPFARYGVYIQEVKNHITVWGSDEEHPVSDPGAVSRSGGFGFVSNVGTSSIPFREYVNYVSHVIPGGEITAHVAWTDIWGRRWSQPVRTVVPEAPPIPPPLRNFMMTSTFEMLRPDTGERVLEWASDEPVDVHVQVKLLNNYPKYFDLTACQANSAIGQVSNPDGDREFLHQTFSRKYGVCWSLEAPVVMQGITLTELQMELVYNRSHCIDDPDIECPQDDLPIIKRRGGGSEADPYNYAQQVADYYPEFFIDYDAHGRNYRGPRQGSGMWDLTHYDYADDVFAKSYPWHMENKLPNIDNLEYYQRPENVIAFPIWIGFGYAIDYDKNYETAKFPRRKGWWGSNLQNRDYTILAGQDASNLVPPGAPDLTEGRWIALRDLEGGPSVQEAVETELKNIYSCMYNRHRIKVPAANTKRIVPHNIFQNNVVPILPETGQDDSRITDFDCSAVPYQFDEYNISQVDNYVTTGNARDWLYFASSLRGGSREAFNVIYKVRPIGGVSYEGHAKMFDGGRFVYRNPANGPNSYLVVDNPVQVVRSKRSDITIQLEPLPAVATTHKPRVYNLISIADPAEIEREWDFPIWINHLGFGNAGTSIYVGGTKGSSCILSPGDTTYAKVEILNNAGWDWELLANGIVMEATQDLENKETEELLRLYKAFVDVPLKYTFMEPQIPDELAPFLNITPSQHNAGAAPLFFDLNNINPATVRDGFKGSYFWQIDLADEIPVSIRGRMWEIPLFFNESLWRSLPGYNDPTYGGPNDYHIELPAVVIAIPYEDDHPRFPGKIFYTSGFSKNLGVSQVIPDKFDLKETVQLDLMDVQSLRSIVASPEDMYANLEAFFQAQIDAGLTVGATVDMFFDENGVKHNRIFYDLNSVMPSFPVPVDREPDTAVVYFLQKLEKTALPYGENVVSESMTISYEDCVGKTKSTSIPVPVTRKVEARGAWLELSYVGTLVGSSLLEKDRQILTPGEGGIIEVLASTLNSGSDIGYNVNFTVVLEPDVVVVEEEIPFDYRLYNSTRSEVFNLTDVLPEDEPVQVLDLFTNEDITPGVPTSVLVYLMFEEMSQPAEERARALHAADPRSKLAWGPSQTPTSPGAFRRAATLEDLPVVGNRGFVAGMLTTIDLTASAGDNVATQDLPETFSVPLVDAPAPPPVPIAIVGAAYEVGGMYTANVTAVTNGELPGVRYAFRRRVRSPFYITWDTVSVQDSASYYDTFRPFCFDTPVFVDYIVAAVSLTDPPRLLHESDIWSHSWPLVEGHYCSGHGECSLTDGTCECNELYWTYNCSLLKELDLGVSISAPQEATPGDKHKIVVTVANIDAPANEGKPWDATGVVLNITIPITSVDIAVVENSLVATRDGICEPIDADGLVTCSFGKIPMAAVATVEFWVAVDPLERSSFAVVAEAAAEQVDYDSANNVASFSVDMALDIALELLTDIELDKQVVAGTDLEFAVFVTNHGLTTATMVQVTVDQSALAAGSATSTGIVATPSTSCPFNIGTGSYKCTWSGAPLAHNATVRIDLVYAVDSAFRGELGFAFSTECAESQFEEVVEDNVGQAVITAFGEIDLAVTRNDAETAASAVPGTTFAYYFNVSNGGPSAALGLTASVTLRGARGFTLAEGAGVSCDYAAVNGGIVPTSCDPNALCPISCSVPALAEHGAVGDLAIVGLDIEVDPAARGFVSYDLAIASSVDSEIAPGDEALAERDKIAYEPRVNITVRPLAVPDEFVAGKTGTLVFTVDNAGPSSALETVANYLFDTSVFSMSSTSQGCAAAETGVLCTTSLGPLGSTDLSFSYMVDPGFRDDVELVASVTAAAGEDDVAITAEATRSATVPVVGEVDLQAAWTITPSAPKAGEPTTLRLAVVNAGPSTAFNVYVELSLTNEADETIDVSSLAGALVGGGAASCDTANLPVVKCEFDALQAKRHLTSAKFSYTATVGLGPWRRGIVAVSAWSVANAADAELVPASNNATKSASVQVVSDLVVVHNAPATVNAGENITLWSSVVNNGPSAAKNISLAVSWNPDKVMFPGVVLGADDFTSTNFGDSCVISDGLLSCVAQALELSEVAEVQVIVTTLWRSRGALVSSAVAASDAVDQEVDSADNTRSKTTQIAATADLSVAFVVSPPTEVVAGAPLTLNLSVDSLGAWDALSASLSASISKATLESATVSAPDGAAVCSGLSCDLKGMDAGTSAWVAFEVATGPASRGTLEAMFSVTSATETDDNDSNSEATAILALVPEPSLSLAVAGSSEATAGTQYTLPLTVTNAGVSTALDAALNISIPCGARYVSSTPTGVCTEVDGFLICLLDIDPAGGVQVVSLVFDVASDARAALVFDIELAAAESENDQNVDPAAHASTKVVTVAAIADLSATVVIDETDVVAGEVINIAFSVACAGPSSASLPRLNLTIEPIEAIVESSLRAALPSACTLLVSDSLLVCIPDGPLAPGDNWMAGLGIIVASGFRGASIMVTAIAENMMAIEEDEVAANNVVSDTVAVSLESDSVAWLHTTSSEVVPQVPAVFAFGVRAAGPSDSFGVSLVSAVDVAESVSIVESDFDVCTVSGTNIVCNTSQIPVGRRFEVVVSVVAGALARGRAHAAAEIFLETPAVDPNLTNNGELVLSLPVRAEADVSVTLTSTSAVAGTQMAFLAQVRSGTASQQYATGLALDLYVPVDRTSFIASGDAVSVSPPTAATCTYNSSTGLVACTFLPTAPETLVMVTVYVVVDIDAAGTLSASAVVSANEADTDMANNRATTSQIITGQVDLSIITSAEFEPLRGVNAAAGLNISVTVMFSNAGPSLARAATLELMLPAGGALLVAESATDAACSTAECAVDLAPGETATLIIVMATYADFRGQLVVGASVSVPATGASVVLTELAPVDNTASIAVSVEGFADVGLSLALVPPAPIGAAQSVTYVVSVFNAGPSDANEVVFSADLHEGSFIGKANLTVAEGIMCAFIADTATVECAVSVALIPGDVRVVEIALDVSPSMLGTMEFAADVISVNETDVNADNNGVTDASEVTLDTDISLRIEGSPTPVLAGLSFTPAVVLFNNGPCDNHNPVAKITIEPVSSFVFDPEETPPTCERTSAGPEVLAFTCLAGTVRYYFDEPTFLFHLIVAADASGEITIGAEVVSADEDADTGNNNATAVFEVLQIVDLQTTIRQNGTSLPEIVAGESGVFLARIENVNGAVAAGPGIDIVLSQYGGLVALGQFWPTVAGSGSCSLDEAHNALNCTTSAPLVIGASFEIAFLISVDHSAAAAGVADFALTAIGQPGSGTDLEPLDNVAEVSVAVMVAAPVVAVLEASTRMVYAGRDVQFFLSGENEGPSDATGFSGTLTIPAAAALLSVGCELADNVPLRGACMCDNTTGAAGETVIVCDYTAALWPGDKIFVLADTTVDPAHRGRIHATATIVHDQAGAPASLSQDVYAQGRADVAIAISASPEPVVAGEEITYTVTVQNLGPTTSNAVQFEFFISDMADFVSTRLLSKPAGTSVFFVEGGVADQSGRVQGSASELSPFAGLDTIEFSVTARVNPATRGVLTASGRVVAGYEDDPDTSDNGAAVFSDVAVSTDIASVSLLADPVLAAWTPGLNYELTFEYICSGPSSADVLELRFAVLHPDVTFVVSSLGLPAGTEYSCELQEPEEGSDDDAYVVCTVDALAPSTVPLEGRLGVAVAASATGWVLPEFEIAFANLDQTDPDVENNRVAMMPIELVPEVDVSAALVCTGAALPLGSPETAIAGEQVKCSASFSNAGPSVDPEVRVLISVTGGDVVGALPTGCKVDPSPVEGVNAAVACEAGAVLPGADVLFVVSLRVHSSRGGELEVRAERLVQAGAVTDTDAANDAADFARVIACPSGLYGVSCNVSCLAAVNCSGRGQCDMFTGSCSCVDGFFGPICEPPVFDSQAVVPANSTRIPVLLDDTPGSMTFAVGDQIEFNPGGANAESNIVKAIVSREAADSLASAGSRELGSVRPWDIELVWPLQFRHEPGEPIGRADLGASSCSALTDCGLRGVCTTGGGCSCFGNYAGDDCGRCKPGYEGDSCLMTASPGEAVFWDSYIPYLGAFAFCSVITTMYAWRRHAKRKELRPSGSISVLLPGAMSPVAVDSRILANSPVLSGSQRFDMSFAGAEPQTSTRPPFRQRRKQKVKITHTTRSPAFQIQQRPGAAASPRGTPGRGLISAMGLQHQRSVGHIDFF